MLKNCLEKYQANHLLRERCLIEKRFANNVIIYDKKPLINFASNDYLGMALHPQVKQAFIQGIHQYGFGSGSSALISGFYGIHRALEEKFAEFLGREDAVLFNSGYLANIGVLSTLANRQSLILSDKLCHASILDGIQLTRATHYRFRHNDIAHAKMLLSKNQQPSLLMTEGVFSMEGDISAAKQLAHLARQHNAALLIDDAHGIGVLGKSGRGTCEHYSLNQQDVPVLIVPLGKAFGSIGAIVAGSKQHIAQLLQFCRTYHYTTALPPAIACASLKAIDIIENEKWRLDKLQSLIKFFIAYARYRDLKLLSEDLTPIKSILIGDNEKALTLKKRLLENGYFTACIRSPTVPKDAARLRISLNCFHTENAIQQLLDLIRFADD